MAHAPAGGHRGGAAPYSWDGQCEVRNTFLEVRPPAPFLTKRIDSAPGPRLLKTISWGSDAPSEEDRGPELAYAQGLPGVAAAAAHLAEEPHAVWCEQPNAGWGAWTQQHSNDDFELEVKNTFLQIPMAAPLAPKRQNTAPAPPVARCSSKPSTMLDTVEELDSPAHDWGLLATTDEAFAEAAYAEALPSAGSQMTMPPGIPATTASLSRVSAAVEQAVLEQLSTAPQQSMTLPTLGSRVPTSILAVLRAHGLKFGSFLRTLSSVEFISNDEVRLRTSGWGSSPDAAVGDSGEAHREPGGQWPRFLQEVVTVVVQHLSMAPGCQMNLATLGNRIPAKMSAELKSQGVKFGNFLRTVPEVTFVAPHEVKLAAPAPARVARSANAQRFRRGEFVAALRARTLNPELNRELMAVIEDVRTLLLQLAQGDAPAATATNALGNKLSPASRCFLKRCHLRLNELLKEYPSFFLVQGGSNDESVLHVTLTAEARSEDFLRQLQIALG
mmetsp:Transcript_14187/g.30681  ORF Transcript_14187/g.30681 Transcript_14187/m.30681 type:complete len:500 (+) Transcript_14187:65-1564(+)|eukprot:CAMPEP_0204316704 /NCGR_PEP_ID=MMETSP0469-20131031/5543_1 /ASSEMBLY_ACC=CAM_ASM_000384 /TAXON_ID=2969 /ORGANISM="Oxyrrhis marina" /LENGTH=499 /DNA_ID=CAMNT_0051297505 /DNA_START=13 /DNA_END=1509 /DNA_ORIENTATION=-